jgi:hypothetical protein
MGRHYPIILIVCLVACLSAGSALAETMILKLSKTEIAAKEDQPAVSAYIVDGVELTAAGKAGETKGVDVILVNVTNAEEIEKIKADESYLSGNYFDLLAKYPEIARDVLECEIDGNRKKLSECTPEELENGRIMTPAQIAGEPSDPKYFDAEGTKKEVDEQ